MPAPRRGCTQQRMSAQGSSRSTSAVAGSFTPLAASSMSLKAYWVCQMVRRTPRGRPIIPKGPGMLWISATSSDVTATNSRLASWKGMERAFDNSICGDLFAVTA